MTDHQIDEFLEMLAKSPTSARDMVRGLFADHGAKAGPDEPFGHFRADAMGWTDCAADDEGAIALYERPAAPAVPQGIPVLEVIDAIEAWKSAWAKVPPFGNKVNKATREAITFSHNTLFQLLWSAQQAQRMPKACPTPTGCGPHGCHGACITVTTPAPSQPVTLTDAVKALDDLQSAFMSHTQWNGTPPSEVIAARAIIAALREKEKAK